MSRGVATVAAMVEINGAFVPVSDPKRLASWYSDVLGLKVVSVDQWSAVLAGDKGSAVLTLLGPDSGIKATPGLPWATHSLAVADLDGVRADLLANGHGPSEPAGDPQVCRWFTLVDPDGNTLLVVDR